MAYSGITAEIISIGDEITSGAILDTNAQWLSRQLATLGVRVLYHVTVGDELEPMVQTFKQAMNRSTIVLVTGGLGPTEDDLTRQAAAQAMGVELREDSVSLTRIREMFARRQRVMPQSNIIQAWFPEGAHVITNPGGTAPGFMLEGNRSNGSGRFCMQTFPGVPAEMKDMWKASARKYLEDFLVRCGLPRRYLKTKLIHCFGAGESEIESRLPHLIRRDHVPTVGITAKLGVITLRIAAVGSDEKECDQQIRETSKIIYDQVGHLVFGEDEQTLASVVSDKLLALHKSVACLEWGSHGALTSCIAPHCFAGSWIMPAEKPFVREELRSIFKSFPEQPPVDYYLIVGPYPQGASEEELAGRQVSVCVYDTRTDELKEDLYHFAGHPSIIDSVFCNRVLNLLRQML
ncbi:MAG: molybdopterin-binding protein [Thermoguttaceae bacterium]|nr:molybdopterin-binding protein [Thermoguttaceae bacterium]